MAAHCWHIDSHGGFTSVRGDGARPYVCCNCGAHEHGSVWRGERRPPGHGPHVPSEHVAELRPPPAGECPCATG